MMNAEEINQMIIDNDGLVGFVLTNFYPTYRFDEDLRQEGLIGLWRACKSFDENKGVQFSTYASRCIRNEINLSIARSLTQKRTLDQANACDSLDREILLSGSSTDTMHNMIPDRNVEPSALGVLEFYKSLDKRKQKILQLHMNGAKIKNIAVKLDVSGQTVRRILHSVKSDFIEECM